MTSTAASNNPAPEKAGKAATKKAPTRHMRLSLPKPTPTPQPEPRDAEQAAAMLEALNDWVESAPTATRQPPAPPPEVQDPPAAQPQKLTAPEPPPTPAPAPAEAPAAPVPAVVAPVAVAQAPAPAAPAVRKRPWHDIPPDKLHPYLAQLTEVDWQKIGHVWRMQGFKGPKEYLLSTIRMATEAHLKAMGDADPE